MLEAIELLKKEIDRIKVLSYALETRANRLHLGAMELPNLYSRAKYRKGEIKRFQAILDLLKRFNT